MASVVYNIGKQNKPKDPFYTVGKKNMTVRGRLQVVVASAAVGDIYVLAEGLSLADRIDSVVAVSASGTLTAANSWDIGFYKLNSAGAMVPVKASGGNELVSAADYSAGIAAGTDLIAGMSDANSWKGIGDLMSLGVDAEPAGGVFLGLRSNVAPTTNNRTLDIRVTIEEATR